MPGRASYSAQTTTWSGPDPARAWKAVGRSQMPDSTAKPYRVRASPSQALARSSSHLISGWAWMRWLSSTSSLSTRSNAARAAALAPAASVSVTMAESLGRHDLLDGPGEGVGSQVRQRHVVGAHRLGQAVGKAQAEVAVLGVDDKGLDPGGGDLRGGSQRHAGGTAAGLVVGGRPGRGGSPVGDDDDHRPAVGVAVAGGSGDV